MIGVLTSLIIAAAACGPDCPGRSLAPPQSASADLARQRADTVAVRRFLVSRGYQVERLLPNRRPFYAAIVTEPSGSLRQIVVVRFGADLPALLSGSVPIGDVTPGFVQWVTLGDSPVSGDSVLQISFDDLVEGHVGTVLYRADSDTLRRLYQDARGACRPAEFVDLDGDSTLEFVVHLEDPADGSCGETCHLMLFEQFGIQPGWLRVHRWIASRLVTVEQDFPAFYARLSVTYARIHEWLQSSEPDALRCRSVYWLARDPDMFRRWSHRAQDLASPRGGR